MANVVTWRADYREDFERLNREWIEAHFVVEPGDEAVFRDPGAAIVAPGGQIFFVVENGRVHGTCALIPHAPGVLELAKMAVEPSAQGRGYGDLLVKAALGFAAEAGATRLMLVSNTRLGPALNLYRKHGFRDVPLDAANGYSRADIQLEVALGP